jgi:hypothetical protein
VAHRVMEAHRFGAAETWRSYRSRVGGITAAVRALLTPASPAGSARSGLPGGGARQLPAADLDDGLDRIGGLTRAEIDALSMEQWETARTRFGLGARPAGVLD